MNQFHSGEFENDLFFRIGIILDDECVGLNKVA